MQKFSCKAMYCTKGPETAGVVKGKPVHGRMYETRKSKRRDNSFVRRIHIKLKCSRYSSWASRGSWSVATPAEGVDTTAENRE